LSDHFAGQAARAAGLDGITEGARAIGLQQAMYVIPALSVVLAAVLWAAQACWPARSPRCESKFDAETRRRGGSRGEHG
jgi:hypothetical protein